MPRQIYCYDAIPDAGRDGLIRHILFGDTLGSFLEAVLANDLIESASRADDVNRQILFVYASFLHNVAPAGSFGSVERVSAWRKERDELGPLGIGQVGWPNLVWEQHAHALVAGRTA